MESQSAYGLMGLFYLIWMSWELQEQEDGGFRAGMETVRVRIARPPSTPPYLVLINRKSKKMVGFGRGGRPFESE
ncbi:hypothetical protein ADN00_03835 [Ornatilinea apprima]|uniref:Uncharacterized protein n=1 Tax=Ornatilinea apprima TaxID=1134406 RepID=A0A0P6XUY8_9CHLR|nr:hypothetical protein ADN00_03835 [Ornatilinea apprima]